MNKDLEKYARQRAEALASAKPEGISPQTWRAYQKGKATEAQKKKNRV